MLHVNVTASSGGFAPVVDASESCTIETSA